MTAFDYARFLLGHGLSVVPVPLGRKVPVLPWKGYQERLPTLAEVRRWFAHEMNIAIVTGRVSEIIAVDADSHAAADW